MALYMMQIKPVSRSTGRSATAAAAYRSGTEITCERENITHDYTRKTGIYKNDSQIITPSGISADWAQDRNVLWNLAEHAEKRKDARVAREYIIALPQEATALERKELALSLSKYIADRYGVAVDMNLHAPHVIDGVDNGNYHAHLLTTTRLITESGLGGKSEVELSDTDRGKRNLSLSKDEVVSLRSHWAELQNTVLEKYGVQVSSLTLEAQGIDREPTLHMGAERTELERDGFATLMGTHNQNIELRNLEKEYGNPLALSQEIQVTENLIAKLTIDRDQALESSPPPTPQQPTFDFEAIRAQARAKLAVAQTQIKADQARDKQRLMDAAREQGRIEATHALAALKQQRMDGLLEQLEGIAQMRREQQRGYSNESVFWRELPNLTKAIIDDAAAHGIDHTRKDLLTLAQHHAAVDPVATLERVFKTHDDTLVTLKEKGTLLDTYVEPKAKPQHEQTLEKTRGQSRDDNDHGMSM